MNTADVQVWKDITSQLKTNIQENEAMISEIKEQIALQNERNKKEVLELALKAAKQLADLEDLRAQVEADGLFSLPSDKEAREGYVEMLQERIDQSRQIIEHANALLGIENADEQTLAQMTSAFGAETAQDADAAKEEAEAEETPVPRIELATDFEAGALLGNWIHYFQKDIFTCQSFWDDSEFKEYDFRDSQLDEERGGQYTVEDGKVILNYSNGDRAEYAVTSYSDESINYMIGSTPIRFDYMPEDLLNSMLEECVGA